MDEIAYMFFGGHDDDPLDEDPAPTPNSASTSASAPGLAPSPLPPVASSVNKTGYMSHPRLEAVGEVADDEPSEAATPPVSPTPATPRKRRGFRDFLSNSKANIQDQLLDKYVTQSLPKHCFIASRSVLTLRQTLPAGDSNRQQPCHQRG